MWKYLFYSFFLTLCQFSVFSQDIEEYSKEYSFAVNLNTNGGLPAGVSFKYAKITDNPRLNTTYGIEIVSVRHPQEYKYSNPYLSNSQPFVRGKANYLYSFRFQFGKDAVLFRKALLEGVQVNAVFAGGLSLGLLKPYAIRYDLSPSGSFGFVTKDVPFYNYDFSDADKFRALYGVEMTEDRIVGRGSFLEAWEGVKVVPGLNAKIGLAFEASAFKHSITGIETGFTLEMFSEKMKVLNVNSLNEPVKNYQTFAAMYLNFFFGARK
ncbi:MAG: hypothetical protein SFU27_05600 [Thermonemataceae bacterium]|nr:hypothetical protein [Thermonemataceae bacterium]